MINNAKDYKKYASKPNFVSQKIFRKNFVAIHETKPVFTLNNLIYVGFSILVYNYIKRKYDVNLLFTDTDSLVYDIETNDVYEDFYKDKDLFDFSDYPQDSRFFDPVNKKVIGYMKDDIKGKIISEFVGLKSKMYSLIDVDNEENKKAKGVNKKVVKKIRHKEYIDVLFNKKIIRGKMKRIQSKLYKIGTYKVIKIFLSCFDDKRYILDDDVNSLAYFDKDILKNKIDED